MPRRKKNLRRRDKRSKANNRKKKKTVPLRKVPAYVTRVDALLSMHAKNHEFKVDVVDLVLAIYPNLDLFVVDYARYVESVDKDRFFARNQAKCNLAQCAHIKREYVMTRGDLQETYDLNESKAISLCQMLDQLHIVKYHLIDIGLRHKADRDEGNIDGDEHKDADFDRTLSAMRNSLTAKRTAFRAMRGSNRNEKVLSKFVTETALENGDADEKCSVDSHQSMANYSFGFRFFYWPFYKGNEATTTIITGNNLMELGNTGMAQNDRLCDFFVAPSFVSLKHEALNATGASLSIVEYDGTMETAKLKHRALKREMNGACYVWDTIYNIKAGSVISLHHIMAVLLYTDHDALSAAFTRSFRKLSVSESVESVKRRHSRFANWAKALREAVECWGTPLIVAADYAPEFYHGLSTKMLFSGFRQFFRGPTSTSLQFEVAVTFANQGANQNGIVIALKNDRSANFFFNCIRWSRFSAESEMLFVGGFQLLEICRLSVIGTALRFDRWIRGLSVLSSALQGQPMPEKVTRADAKTVHLLVACALKEEIARVIPVYIQKLLGNMLNVTRIELDI